MGWPEAAIIIAAMFVGTFVWFVNLCRGGLSIEKVLDKALKDAEHAAEERVAAINDDSN